MKTAIQSAAAGLLALTLGALCLADSPKPPASATKGTWKSSVVTTTVEGLPAAHIASLPDLVVVPVEGTGPSGKYYGFKVTNVGRSSTKSSTTLSFECWESVLFQGYSPFHCRRASAPAMIGPLAPRSSSQVFPIWDLSSYDPLVPRRFVATVDKQDLISEAKENNNIARWDYGFSFH